MPSFEDPPHPVQFNQGKFWSWAQEFTKSVAYFLFRVAKPLGGLPLGWVRKLSADFRYIIEHGEDPEDPPEAE